VNYLKDIKQEIKKLAKKYAKKLKKKCGERILEMESDDNSHYLIYRVLGISAKEGKLIDEYQNLGRFLYKYAGSFLEEATILCYKNKFPDAKKTKVKNNLGSKPENFEIDCLLGNKAYEIKWRDATTDGDHITKEHTRIKVILSYGYVPIRIMFYYPNREQAIKVQDTLRTLYSAVNGEYYYGDNAWDYVRKQTDIDLKQILIEITK
jgi:hypothetical protein